MNLLDPVVSALTALTKPISNTRLKEPVWFFCTFPTASFHRTDGKKLPFVNNFLKVEFQEDLDYLLKESEDNGNPYLRQASPDEIRTAKIKENPIEGIKEAVKSEIENTYSIEELEALILRRKQVVANKPFTDEAKLAGVDKAEKPKDVVIAQGTLQPAHTQGHVHHAAHSGVSTGNIADAIKAVR